MQSKSSSSKATKGSVVVFNSHNRLQLRFRFGGKRRYISLGLADTQLNRRFAELKAAEIEQDILKEKFDTTLEKYKSASDREKKYIASQEIETFCTSSRRIMEKILRVQKAPN